MLVLKNKLLNKSSKNQFFKTDLNKKKENLQSPDPVKTDQWPTLGSPWVEKHWFSKCYADLIATASIPIYCRVVVLADPAVCSELLQKAIQEHLGVSHVLRDTAAVQMNVILHVLQAGLGMQCHSSRVSQALKVRKCLFWARLGIFLCVLLSTPAPSLCVLFVFQYAFHALALIDDLLGPLWLYPLT